MAVKYPVSWHQQIADSVDEYGTFTRRLSRAEVIRLASQVALSPVLVQPYVEKKYELRVTVVGDALFTCRIYSQESELSRIDWRHYDLENVPHIATKLPNGISNAIRTFMRLSGLRFAAIDLIVEPSGRVRFVEANPSGQFAWIESMTGLGIERAITSWLTFDD